MNLWRGIGWLGRRWLATFIVAALLIVAYLWAGSVLAPRLIRTEATRWAQARPGVTLSLGTIKVDPVHLTVSIRNIRLDAQGRALASARRVLVGLEPLSLLAGTYHLSTLELDAPRLDVVVGADGRVNLAALAAPAGKHSTHAPPPRLRVDDLRIDDGRLSVLDHRHSPAARLALAPITFRLVHFRSWARHGGQFALQADGEHGSQIAFWGAVSVAPLAATGGVSIRGEPLTALARFAPTHLAVRPRAGRLNLTTQYQLGEGPQGLHLVVSDLALAVRALELDGGTLLHGTVQAGSITLSGGSLHLALHTAPMASLAALTLRNVRLSGTGPAHGQHASLQQLALGPIQLNGSQHRISIARLALRGVHLPIERLHNGRLALLRLLPGAEASHAAAATPGSTRAVPTRWAVQLARLALRDVTVPVTDRSVEPSAHFEVHLYSLSARALSTDLARAVPFTLRAGLAPRAYLAVNGRVIPGRRSAALWVSLTRLALRPFTPYLPLARTAEVHSGSLGVRGFAEVDAGRLVRLRGQAELGNLQLLARASGIGLFGWRKLEVHGIAYRSGRLVIGAARLDAPVGRIVILPNHTLNLAALFPPAKRSGKAPAPAQRMPAAQEAATTAVLLRRLDILNGSIRFADESIEPHFHAPINDLHGSISDLSTSRQALAQVALAGQVIDRYSPVSIRGTFNPYGLGSDTDIRAGFENIQLPIFDPYSDRYAGYAIAKGILSAHFRYRIDARKLNAEHRIVVEQLQWGGASSSQNRVGWPIRLATALLKDRNGVIRINLPVTGSLNNPDFHIASIVWTMLWHLLEKAALAPFDLIGKLFAGAAQAQYIAFRPGSAALPHTAATSLVALSHALAARPALRVDIPAGPAAALDATALKNQRIAALVLARLHRAPPGGLAALPVRQQRQLLAALYWARLQHRPHYPAHLPQPPAGKSGTAAAKRLARLRVEVQWLQGQLRATVHLHPGALRALGLARAQHVQEALLAHGALEAKRVFLTTKRAGRPWHGRVRLKLGLQ